MPKIEVLQQHRHVGGPYVCVYVYVYLEQTSFVVRNVRTLLANNSIITQFCPFVNSVV